MWNTLSYNLVRPLFLRLDPETAHHLALKALRLLRTTTVKRATRPYSLMGIDFPNRVGLAAGLDKNGDYIDDLARLGFGFIEIGTVTPRPQPGNAKPRLFRLPAAQALINRMGFNNKGVDYLINQVERSRFDGVLGINIGKNADTSAERAVEDYLIGLRTVYPYAHYITINISSPNTPGLRDLQYGESLNRLLYAVKEQQTQLNTQHGRYVPIAIKIAPDLTPEDIQILSAALLNHELDAVIATNTTFSRQGVDGLAHADEAGGLSGAPLCTSATDVVQQLKQCLQDQLPIIAVGGIMSAADAQAKLDAGACLVQVYTGLIYRGPTLVEEILTSFNTYMT